MSKRVLWILTVALSLTLLGLIFIQIRWIQSAVELKDRQFQQLVNSTLTDVSRQLDQYYTRKRMNDIIEEKLSEEPDFGWLVDPDIKSPFIHWDSGVNSSIPFGPEGEGEMAEIVGDSVIVITHQDGGVLDTIDITGYQ